MATTENEAKADSNPSVTAAKTSVKHDPTTNPPLTQPVFEAGAGRGGVADHSIVSPAVDLGNKPDDKAN